MNWKVKRFQDLSVEELYNILRLRTEVFILEQNCLYLDCDNKDKSAYHLFLENDNEIAAYLRILDKGISYDEISIGRVIVNPKYRGKGLAVDLLTRGISFVKENLDENSIRISAQAHLANLYKSVGFKVVSEEYLEDDIPHIEMLY